MTTDALTDGSFDAAVLDSELPVLVDFWGENCAQCRLLSRVLDELEPELEGRLAVRRVNVTEHGAAALRYDVMSVPTLILFVHGVPVTRLTGARPRSAIMSEIRPYLDPTTFPSG